MKNSAQTFTRKKRVLLIASFPAPFIDVDVKIIKELADVTVLIKSGIGAIFSIFRKEFACDIIFCWFGSVYAAMAVLFSKILRKRSIVVLGGVDAAALPEINYGIWLSPWKSCLLRHSLPRTDLILVVAPSMKDKIRQLARYSGANIKYLPTGYNTDFWKPAGKKERLVLTVGDSDSETRIRKKGLDYLCQAAEQMPGTKFILIGVEKSRLEAAAIHVPPNVQTLPKLTQEELLKHYQRAKVFCQPSRSEGMPNTLCEAMACGCIPVGTDTDGIPTAIGDTGFVVPPGDIDALAAALQTALDSDESQGLHGRQRIIDEFPLERRIKGLKKAILEVKDHAPEA